VLRARGAVGVIVGEYQKRNIVISLTIISILVWVWHLNAYEERPYDAQGM